MEETVTTFGETTEWWLAAFYGPLLWLIDLLSSLLSWAWGVDMLRQKLKQTLSRLRRHARLVYDRMYEVYHMLKPV